MILLYNEFVFIFFLFKRIIKIINPKFQFCLSFTKVNKKI
jgi:hypothetical protein